MIIRLLCLLLLAVTATAGSFLADWPAGKIEKLSYTMTSYYPAEMNNSVIVEVSKSAGANPFFTIKQTIDVPAQSVKLTSTEKYRADNLRFISSENLTKLPPEAKAQMGTDSILIVAKLVGDSIEITSSFPQMPGGKIAYSEGMSTQTGSLLTARDFDFKVGSVRKTNTIDLVNLSGQPFKAELEVDSVLGEESITTPAGTFACFKVRSSSGGMTTNSYFAKEAGNIPVMMVIEAPGQTGPQTVAKLVLQKKE